MIFFFPFPLLTAVLAPCAETEHWKRKEYEILATTKNSNNELENTKLLFDPGISQH